MSRMVIDHKDHLYWFVQYVIDGGGEGVILQRKWSSYKRGRSLDVMKFKV